MSSKFSKAFSLHSLRKAFSAFSPFGVKMVRYFTNPYEDYSPSVSVTVDQNEFKKEIDAHIANITKRLPPSRKNVDGGLYVGVTGIAYMFYSLSKNPLLSENKALYIQKGLEYLKPAMETSAGDKASFLLGDAGTYAIATVLYKAADNPEFHDSLKAYKSLYNSYLHPKFLKCGGDEFFVGRSGYLAGALWMSRELKMNIFSRSELHKICDVIVASGRDYALKHKSPCPLMYHYYNTEYLGAAHGISFILQMLMTVPGFLENHAIAAKDVKATVDYMAAIQTEEGNWPCCIEEIGLSDHKLVHWCHGAPGTIYLMAKAYKVFKEEKYLNACIKAGEAVWNRGLLRKGPGICHGVAGNGYVFLLLYRLTGNDKYLYRAKMFAEFMSSDEFVREARLPDNPESLYEGTAGTLCFLSDLLVPDKAEFPFQDVFCVYEF